MNHEKQTYTKRSLNELNLLDNFLFNEAITGEEGTWFCRYFLQLLLGSAPGDIQIKSQEVIQGIATDTHGIRIDLYVDEAEGALYDFEPDNYTTGKALPRRARFYHALTDSKRLESGTNYEELRDLWIIFILPHDPFGKGRMRYTMSMNCEEIPELPYDDGVKIVYLNTKGNPDENKPLSQLLRYMEKSTEKNAVTRELQHLNTYIQQIRTKQEVGVKYMRLWELEKIVHDQAHAEGLAKGLAEGRTEGRAEGRAEGRTEGRAEGRAEGLAEGRTEGRAEGYIIGYADSILSILQEKGDIPPSLEDQIRQEKDLDTLKRWLVLAINTENIDSFSDMIQP